jgi:hypothetical protein
MFGREKRIGPYTYVYLVETVREDGKTKQRIIHTLGRKEDVEQRGDLDRLARSIARLAQRSMVLSLLEAGGVPQLSCQRIGPPLLFERFWDVSVPAEAVRRWRLSGAAISCRGGRRLAEAVGGDREAIGSGERIPGSPETLGGRAYLCLVRALSSAG